MKKIGLILGLLNTVAIAAVLGLFVYTRVIYKRPAITEEKEREKLAQGEKTRQLKSPAQPVIVGLEPITVNLDPYAGEEGKQKVHYASVTLSIQLRDHADQAKFNAVMPVVMDKIIQNLSKKKFEELNQVQGRYLFRSQIIDSVNEYLGAPIVTEVYFADFLLQ